MSKSYEPAADSVARVGPEERGYLLGRAEAHRVLSMKTTQSGPRSTHVRLQHLYEQRAANIPMVVPD